MLPMMDSPISHVPKKRRFFKDNLDDDPDIQITSLSEVAPPTPITSQPSSPMGESTAHDTLLTFSEQLLAILDEDITPQVIHSLEDASGGNIERAVNMFFDGSWATHIQDDPPRGLISTIHAKRPLE